MSSQAPSQVKGESQVVKAEADPAYINLKVKQQVSLALRIINSAAPSHTAFQDGAITHFRIKRSTQMRKVTSPVLHFALSCLTPYCAAYGELLYARRDWYSLREVSSFSFRSSANCPVPPSVRFMFDGNNLSPEATPDDLGMDDYDEIDAMLSQVSVRSPCCCAGVDPNSLSQVGGWFQTAARCCHCWWWPCCCCTPTPISQ